MQLKRFWIAALFAVMSAGAQGETSVGASYLWNHETGGPFEGRGSGYKITVGGYRGTGGAEVGFVNFGKLGGGGPHAQAFTSGINLGFPIGKLQTFGKVGLARSRVSGTATTEEKNRYGLFYGGGVRFGDAQGFGLRAEYERYRLDNDDLESISAGIDYRF